MNIIIIAGMPASGKSTFALKLSAGLGMPVLEKDSIKEELFDTLGFKKYSEKRQLDVAATAVLIRCADDILRSGCSVIIVNNFRDTVQDSVQQMIASLSCNCITVFFEGDPDTFYKRYIERDNLHLRHLGHILQDHFPPHPGESTDYEMTREEFSEKFEKLGMADFSLPGHTINVDATYPERIDTVGLIEKVKQFLT